METTAQYDRSNRKMQISIEYELADGTSMLDAEKQLQEQLNEGGRLATSEILNRDSTTLIVFY